MEQITEFTNKRLKERITDLDDKIVFLNALHKVKDKMLREKKAVIANLHDKITFLTILNVRKDAMICEKIKENYELSTPESVDSE